MADVSAMGAVMIPMMKKEGYHADYAVNVTTHAALVGALMPTSHNMIIYTLAAGGKVSIARLILAGVIPAFVLTVCNIVAAYLVAVKRGYPAGKFPGWEVVGRTFAASIPGLLVACLVMALPAAGQETVRPGEHGLKVGEKAPAFRLQSAEGKEYTLTNLLARGTVALVFYRSAGW